MSTTVERVVSEAMELPPSLRAFVAEKLIESLDAADSPPLSSKWRDEVRRRCAEGEIVCAKRRHTYGRPEACLPPVRRNVHMARRIMSDE